MILLPPNQLLRRQAIVDFAQNETFLNLRPAPSFLCADDLPSRRQRVNLVLSSWVECGDDRRGRVHGCWCEVTRLLHLRIDVVVTRSILLYPFPHFFGGWEKPSADFLCHVVPFSPRSALYIYIYIYRITPDRAIAVEKPCGCARYFVAASGTGGRLSAPCWGIVYTADAHILLHHGQLDTRHRSSTACRCP